MNRDKDKFHGLSRKGKSSDVMKGKIIRSELVKQQRVHDVEIILDSKNGWRRKLNQVLNF